MAIKQSPPKPTQTPGSGLRNGPPLAQPSNRPTAPAQGTGARDKRK